jgi:hypothetical protein
MWPKARQRWCWWWEIGRCEHWKEGQQAVCTSMFITAHAQQQEWDQPTWPMMEEWLKICYKYMCMQYIQLQKEGNPIICENMNRPRQPWAKGNAPCTERQMLHGLTSVGSLKMSNSDAEGKLVDTKAQGWGRNREIFIVGYKMSVR